MTFGQRLERAARLVEERLGAILDGQASAGAPGRVVAAMRHATLGGGKRLRPFLVLETAALFQAPAGTLKAAVDAAAAIELVHCYSLVHDDLPAMDNDDLRRGRPTVHKAFDEWTAILAGDALLTLAFEVLAGIAPPGDRQDGPQVNAALVACLASAAGARGMVGGQCLDLEAEKLGLPEQPNAAPDVAYVERLQAMKTGALIRCACELGAILGGARPEDRRALATYGERLGRAFQIADDLLDVEGDAAAMGKAARKDAAKATLHAASDIDIAREQLAALAEAAVAALTPFVDRAEGLREAVAFTVGRER